MSTCSCTRRNNVNHDNQENILESILVNQLEVCIFENENHFADVDADIIFELLNCFPRLHEIQAFIYLLYLYIFYIYTFASKKPGNGQ